MTRCWWVDARRAEGFPATVACQVAGISTTMFYDWVALGSTGPSDHDLGEAYLVNEMFDIHRESDGTCGGPRVHAELRHRGRVVNHKRVARLMAVHGVQGVFKAAKVRTTTPAEENPRSRIWSAAGLIRAARTGRGLGTSPTSALVRAGSISRRCSTSGHAG